MLRLKYERPLYLGKIYAVNTMLGNKDNMVSWAGSKKLIEKIKTLDIKLIEPERARDEIADMAWKYNLQLYRAERLYDDGTLILTYAFIDPSITDEAYTYTIELAPIGKATLWDRSIGKIFMSEHKKPTPKWAVVDYYTSSDISDYARELDNKIKAKMESILDKSENERERIFEDWLTHVEEMDRRAKDYMKIQNKEVKEYLKSYIKEYRQKNLIF